MSDCHHVVDSPYPVIVERDRPKSLWRRVFRTTVYCEYRWYCIKCGARLEPVFTERKRP